MSDRAPSERPEWTFDSASSIPSSPPSSPPSSIPSAASTPRTQVGRRNEVAVDDSDVWEQPFSDRRLPRQAVPHNTPIDIDGLLPIQAHSAAGNAPPAPVPTLVLPTARHMTATERQLHQLQVQVAEMVTAEQYAATVEYARALEQNALHAHEEMQKVRHAHKQSKLRVLAMDETIARMRREFAQLTAVHEAAVQNPREVAERVIADLELQLVEARATVQGLGEALTATTQLLDEAVDPGLHDRTVEVLLDRAWEAEYALAEIARTQRVEKDRRNARQRQSRRIQAMAVRRVRRVQSDDDDDAPQPPRANLRDAPPAFLRAHAVPEAWMRPPTAAELFGRAPSPAVVQPPLPAGWIQRARDRHVVGQPAAAARATASSSDEDEEEEKEEEDMWAFLDQE